MLAGVEAVQRRKEARSQLRVPVRILGVDVEGSRFEQQAIASNLSISGALLRDVGYRLRHGTVLRLSMQNREGRFRVVWAGDEGPQKYKIAVHRCQGEDCPWEAILTERSIASAAAVSSPVPCPVDRVSNEMRDAGRIEPRPGRRWQRRKVDVPIRVVVHRTAKTTIFDGRGNELSEGGMALTAGVELQPDDVVEVEFTRPYSGLPVRQKGVIRNRTGYRYGIEFIAQTSEERAQIDNLLSALTGM